MVTDRRRVMSRQYTRRFIGAVSFLCVARRGEVMMQAWRIQDTTKSGGWDCTLRRRLEAVTIFDPFRLDRLQQLF
jgi:hypothetical protein